MGLVKGGIHEGTRGGEGGQEKGFSVLLKVKRSVRMPFF